MSSIKEILTSVSHGELDIDTAESTLRWKYIDEYQAALRHVRFYIEIINESDAPDGFSDPPVFQPHVLRCIVDLHRNADGDWVVDELDRIAGDDDDNTIYGDVVDVGSCHLRAGLSGWSELKRHGAFGTKREDVYYRVSVEASEFELDER